VAPPNSGVAEVARRSKNEGIREGGRDECREEDREEDGEAEEYLEDQSDGVSLSFHSIPSAD
jgi:hypothetical protein